MSTEPEREIEKSLRAYATRRREDAGTPPEMHPATRKMLQGEVARQSTRGGDGQGFWQMLWGSWPRITATVSTAAALLLLGVFLMPGLWRGTRQSGDTLLAKNDSARDEKTTELRKRSSDSATRQTETSLKDDDFAKSVPKPVLPSTRESTVAAPATPQPVVVAPSTPARRPDAVDAVSQSLPSAAVATTAPAALAPRAQVRSDSGTGTVSQQFVRVNPPPGPSASPGVRTILDSFRVEQRGNQIRVIDSDGSIYSGAMTPVTNLILTAGEKEKTEADQSNLAAVKGLAGQALQMQADQFAPAEVLSGPGYSFQVSGTNLSLKQSVTFNGTFLPNEGPALASQASPTGGGGGAGGGRAAGGRRGGAAPAQPAAQSATTNGLAAIPGQQRTEPPVTNLYLKLRLQGQAVVGTNQIPINALPGNR